MALTQAFIIVAENRLAVPWVNRKEECTRRKYAQEESMHRKKVCAGRNHAQVRSMNKKEACTGRKFAQEGSMHR